MEDEILDYLASQNRYVSINELANMLYDHPTAEDREEIHRVLYHLEGDDLVEQGLRGYRYVDSTMMGNVTEETMLVEKIETFLKRQDGPSNIEDITLGIYGSNDQVYVDKIQDTLEDMVHYDGKVRRGPYDNFNDSYTYLYGRYPADWKGSRSNSPVKKRSPTKMSSPIKMSSPRSRSTSPMRVSPTTSPTREILENRSRKVSPITRRVPKRRFDEYEDEQQMRHGVEYDRDVDVESIRRKLRKMGV